MMDPSNLDHHHQEELHGGINDADFSTGVLSRDFRLSNEISSPTPTTHMIQNLGFHWGTGNADQSYMNHQATLPSTSCIKHEQMDHEASFLKILTSGCDQANDLQPFAGDLFYGAPRGNYSMVLPTADISRMNPPLSSSPYQVSLGLDLQALDLLASARFGRSFCELPSFDSMGLLREESSTPPFEFGHLQEQDQEPPNSHYKISPSLSGVTESIKRGNNILEHKESQGAPKKSRFDTRSSSSPFKVRKEKLGDRIAALQQLVAPFGKTDTASVLMEAIGYIKFLQDQVETLSVPYMKSSNNIKLRTSQGASSEATDEPNPDLRSRGLCLVPLSYTSYVTNENEGVWSAPNYRGID